MAMDKEELEDFNQMIRMFVLFYKKLLDNLGKKVLFARAVVLTIRRVQFSAVTAVTK